MTGGSTEDVITIANGIVEISCGICKTNKALYRCPACDVRTCSLDCTKVHKGGVLNLSCNGKRKLPIITNLCDYTSEKLIDEYVILAGIKDKVDQFARMYPLFQSKDRKRFKRSKSRRRRSRMAKNPSYGVNNRI